MTSTYISSEFHVSESNVPSSIENTSNPRSVEDFSIFSDGACGEPLLPQHLRIEFSPDDIIDNDIVQSKICAFWKLIHNSPEIQNLRVKPERDSFTKPSESQPESEEEMLFDKTAVSILEFMQEKGLMAGGTFEAKLPQSNYCTLSSREYKENEPVLNLREEKKRVSLPVCKCTTVCTPCPGLINLRRSLGTPREPLTQAKRLCMQLKDWDSKHTNTMEPPGHPPALQHCIMQRQA